MHLLERCRGIAVSGVNWSWMSAITFCTCSVFDALSGMNVPVMSLCVLYGC